MATTRQGSLRFPRRGEVHLVDFDPTVGAEMKKTRPAVVIQNDVANRASPLTIVAAVSSRFDPARLYPTEALVHAPEAGLATDSVVLLNQIRSVDKRRLLRKLGTLRSTTMAAVDRALALSVGLAKA